MKGGQGPWPGEVDIRTQHALEGQKELSDLQKLVVERQIPPPMEQRQRNDALQMAVAVATASDAATWKTEDIIEMAEAFHQFIIQGAEKGEELHLPFDGIGGTR